MNTLEQKAVPKQAFKKKKKSRSFVALKLAQFELPKPLGPEKVKGMSVLSFLITPIF